MVNTFSIFDELVTVVCFLCSLHLKPQWWRHTIGWVYTIPIFPQCRFYTSPSLMYVVKNNQKNLAIMPMPRSLSSLIGCVVGM